MEPWHEARPDDSNAPAPYAYPNPSASLDGSSDAYGQPFAGPSSGPYWPPGSRPPPVHEGFIRGSSSYPNPGIHDPDDNGEDYNFAALSAQFGIDTTPIPQRRYQSLKDTTADPIPMENDSDAEEDDADLFDNMRIPVTGEHDIDPDFVGSDSEDVSTDDSSDGSSLDSLRLDQAIADAEDDVRHAATSSRRGTGGDRGTGGRGGRGGRRRGWKWALAGTEHDPKLNREKSARRGRKPRHDVPKGEGRKRTNYGPKVVEPTPEFKLLLSKAYAPYLAGDYDTAAGFARQAIKCNPEVFAAHSLLSEVLSAQGNEKDALLALKVGALVQRDPEVWKGLAERTLALVGEDRNEEVLKDCVGFYRIAIGRDKTDYDSLREKLNLELELHSLTDATKWLSAARTDCKAMLKERAADLPIIRQYAELVAITGEPSKIRQAKAYFDTAFETYSKGATLGPEQWSYISVYVDLVETVDGPAESLVQLKRLARWLMGRAHETFWDDINADDREFDLKEEPRRAELRLSIDHDFSSDESRYGANLPLELRVKMGLLRVAIGPEHLAEALCHFEPLIKSLDDPSGSIDLYREIADALKKQGHHHQAISFYEPLQEIPDAPDEQYYMDLAACYKAVDRNADAEDCYKIIIDQNEDHIEARVSLCKIYADSGRRELALPLFSDIIKLGRTDAVKAANIHLILNPSDELARPRQRGPKTLNPLRKNKSVRKRAPLIQSERALRAAEQLQASKTTEQRIKANYEVLESCREDVEAGDEDALKMWMQSAESMIQDFRATKVFYPGRDKHNKFTGYGRSNKIMKELEAMRDSWEAAEGVSRDPQAPREGVPTDFHDIKFTVWLDIFCEYGLRLAHAGLREDCYDNFHYCQLAIVFYHDDKAQNQIQATWLASAILLEDEDRICSVSRWFMSHAPFAAEPYQLFAAVNRLYSGAPNWFNSGPMQKYLLRAVKAMDYAVLEQEHRDRYAFTATEISSYTAGGKKMPNHMGISDLDPGLLTLYGHVMAAAQSWSSALNYYFRAFAMEPDNVTLNLCIALAYIQNAMKRQTVNRHWQVLQGVAFLNRYYHLRTRTGIAIHEQEAEYNIGRAWHLLGINHHAVTGYERCLRLCARVKKERRVEDGELGLEDFTREAALCLVDIYALNHNLAAARAITERYLVL